MMNTLDFSSYIQPSKRFKETTNSQIVQENIPDLMQKREFLLKGLLEHLNKVTDSFE
ncbi:hypothetical protein GCM10008119_36090 [Pedobacter mendelii]|uniref:Uncharacterized protein n=1 Tax=Pedobacter mendelii TaxID=1908240 RepID=A0ABQ2BNZ3_9SPHI|nr:hypothetical protein GCM10008119_36090 [Pedobacter mendelii]